MAAANRANQRDGAFRGEGFEMRDQGRDAAPGRDSSGLLDERVFRTHFDNLPGPAFIWRREGDDFRLIAHNRAGAAIGDRRMGPLIGGIASELYGDQPGILADLRACAAGGSVVRSEADFEATSGAVRTFAATCVPLSADTVVAHVEDVTEQRSAARAVAQSEAVIGERERNRIGREIHDGLAQMLTGVKLLMEHLEKRLQDEGSQYVREAAQATELIKHTIGQARELVRGLSPIPEGATLFQGLDLLATHSAKYLGVRCQTSFSGVSRRLGEAALAHLYRIAQEAITNAVRHGKATSIDLSCRLDDSELVLRVADNGSGFVDPEAHGEGLGLKIMRYRARAIGGDIAITRRAAGGTLVTCTCALQALVD